MGLLDVFKRESRKQELSSTEETLKRETALIPESEKDYYQPNSYYKSKSFENTVFEKEVITFEQRKKTTIPSENGLYVPEILMLHFCKKYPNPNFGHPGYWWYKYGIRDVGSLYKSLVERGFLSINEISGKYELTNLGKSELEENIYVPYMHRHSKYTSFTIWDLNQMLGTGDKSKYKEIIEKEHARIHSENEKKQNSLMEDLKESDPESHKVLKDQDDQIKAVQAADKKYSEDENLYWIINFWEDIWRDGGPKFEGSYWMFRLPDLYIKAKRYEDAIDIVQTIKQTRGYHEKADKYIVRIEERKSKLKNK